MYRHGFQERRLPKEGALAWVDVARHGVHAGRPDAWRRSPVGPAMLRGQGRAGRAGWPGHRNLHRVGPSSERFPSIVIVYSVDAFWND